MLLTVAFFFSLSLSLGNIIDGWWRIHLHFFVIFFHRTFSLFLHFWHMIFSPRLSHYIRVFGGRSVFGSIWFGSFGRVCNGVLPFFFIFAFGSAFSGVFMLSLFSGWEAFSCLRCSTNGFSHWQLDWDFFLINVGSGITYRNDLFIF